MDKPRRRKPFLFGLLFGALAGMLLGSTLTGLFGHEASALVRKLVRRLTGERDEPNFEILLQ